MLPNFNHDLRVTHLNLALTIFKHTKLLLFVQQIKNLNEMKKSIGIKSFRSVERSVQNSIKCFFELNVLDRNLGTSDKSGMDTF